MAEVAGRGRVLAPRIITIVFGLFLMIFALDALEAGTPLGRQIAGLLIGVVPGLLVLAIVPLGWRRPRWSGWAALGLALAYTVWFHTWQDLVAFAIVSLPLLLISGLFLWLGAPAGGHAHGDA
jgi:hypothetical protein